MTFTTKHGLGDIIWVRRHGMLLESVARCRISAVKVVEDGSVVYTVRADDRHGSEPAWDRDLFETRREAECSGPSTRGTWR